jgi:catechol 2,3-dioxygenase-like lactoylglutathione lyase family enzyme
MKKPLHNYFKKSIYLLGLLLLLEGCQTPAAEARLTPRFNHVYLNVSDMDRSVSFYTSAFDLEVTKQIRKIKRTPVGGESGEYDMYLSLLKFPGQDFVLEIGENPDFEGNNTGANYTHVGIDVSDIEAAGERVLKAGGIIVRPISLVETEDIKAKTMFFTGPDGETIELMQIISGDF